MAEAGGSGATAPGANPPRDWAALIRARLAGTRPQHERAGWRVPGLSAADSQRLMAHFPAEPRPAAVLVPLVQRDTLTVLLTQRATQLRNHAGQISFPGGRIEPHDVDPAAAALREAHEEIGLESRFVSVVGYLPDHVVMTGFRVTPVVAFVQPGFELLLDSVEVEDTFEVPVDFIFDPSNQRVRMRRSGFTGEEVEFRDIPYGDRDIWGATAGMLLTLQAMVAGGES
ncbi:MAG: CoA pyrophosphatase [Proteobacteria bacterium]|nr:CoA pyrophosphatase [Pseudomonadota bacterium]